MISNIKHKSYLTKFELLAGSGVVQNQSTTCSHWDDVCWVYRSRGLWFVQLRSAEGRVLAGRDYKAKKNTLVPLSSEFSTILKYFIIDLLIKNRDYSPTHVGRYLQPFRWLAEYTEQDSHRLRRFNAAEQSKMAKYISNNIRFGGSNSEYMLHRDITRILNWMVHNRVVATKKTFITCVENKKKYYLTGGFLEDNDLKKKRYPENDFTDCITKIKQILDSNPAIEPCHGYDRIRVLAIPFMLAFGLRIGEVVSLPVDTLFYEAETERLYIRVWTEKGNTPALRYVPKIWASIIRECVEELVELCGEARQVSKALEDSGGYSYLVEILGAMKRNSIDIEAVEKYGYDPSNHLFTRELSCIGLSQKDFDKSNHRYLRSLVIRTSSLNTKWRNLICVDDLVCFLDKHREKYLASHYKRNPHSSGQSNNSMISSPSFKVSQKLSEHLFVVFRHQFRARARTNKLLTRPLTSVDMDAYLGRGGERSIFARFDIRDSGDKVYQLTTHQIRHWNTTSILKEGANEMIIDLWMGRQVGQSREYDHRTPAERAEDVRSIYLNREDIPNDYLGRKIKEIKLVSDDEQAVVNIVNDFIKISHFTPWGKCSRDISISPCTRHLQCLKGFSGEGMCKHFHVDPEDRISEARIIKLRNSQKLMLDTLIPEYSEKEVTRQLNSSEPLDQHISHSISILEGCNEALLMFKNK